MYSTENFLLRCFCVGSFNLYIEEREENKNTQKRRQICEEEKKNKTTTINQVINRKIDTVLVTIFICLSHFSMIRFSLTIPQCDSIKTASTRRILEFKCHYNKSRA